MKELLRCLCRLCAQHDEFCVDLFDNHADKNFILKKIRICLPLKIQKDDGLPRKICFTCINKVDTAYDLHYTALTAQSTIKRLLETEPDLEHEDELLEDDESATHSREHYLKRKRNCPVAKEETKGKKRVSEHEVYESGCTTVKPEDSHLNLGDTSESNSVSIGVQCNPRDCADNTSTNHFLDDTYNIHVGKQRKTRKPNRQVGHRSGQKCGEEDSAAQSSKSGRMHSSTQTGTGNSLPLNKDGPQVLSQQADTQITSKFAGSSTESQNGAQYRIFQNTPTSNLGKVCGSSGTPMAHNVPVFKNVSVQQPTHFLPQRPPQVPKSDPVLRSQQMVTEADQSVVSQSASTATLCQAGTSVPVIAPTLDSSVNNGAPLTTKAANLSAGVQHMQAQDKNVSNGAPRKLASNMHSVASNTTSQNVPTHSAAAKSSSSKLHATFMPNSTKTGRVKYFAHIPSNTTIRARFKAKNVNRVTSNSNVLPGQEEDNGLNRSANPCNPSTATGAKRANHTSVSQQTSTSERCSVPEAASPSVPNKKFLYTSRIHILKPAISDNTFSIQPSSSSNVNSTLKPVDGQQNTLVFRNILPFDEDNQTNKVTTTVEKKSKGTMKSCKSKKQKKNAAKQMGQEHIVLQETLNTPPQPQLSPPAGPHSGISDAEDATRLRAETASTHTDTTMELRSEQCPTSDQRESQSMKLILRKKGICNAHSQLAQECCESKSRKEECTCSEQAMYQSVSVSNQTEGEDKPSLGPCCNRENNLSSVDFHPAEFAKDVKPERFDPVEIKLELDADMDFSGAEKQMCPLCHVEFPPDLLIHHRSLHYREKFYTCLDCNKNFVTEVGLESHRCSKKSD